MLLVQHVQSLFQGKQDAAGKDDNSTLASTTYHDGDSSWTWSERSSLSNMAQHQEACRTTQEEKRVSFNEHANQYHKSSGGAAPDLWYSSEEMQHFRIQHVRQAHKLQKQQQQEAFSFVKTLQKTHQSCAFSHTTDTTSSSPQRRLILSLKQWYRCHTDNDDNDDTECPLGLERRLLGARASVAWQEQVQLVQQMQEGRDWMEQDDLQQALAEECQLLSNASTTWAHVLAQAQWQANGKQITESGP